MWWGEAEGGIVGGAVWRSRRGRRDSETRRLWAHLLQHLLPHLPPQDDHDDGHEDEYDGHQTANQNAGVAVVHFVGGIVLWRETGGKKNTSLVSQLSKTLWILYINTIDTIFLSPLLTASYKEFQLPVLYWCFDGPSTSLNGDEKQSGQLASCAIATIVEVTCRYERP